MVLFEMFSSFLNHSLFRVTAMVTISLSAHFNPVMIDQKSFFKGTYPNRPTQYDSTSSSSQESLLFQLQFCKLSSRFTDLPEALTPRGQGLGLSCLCMQQESLACINSFTNKERKNYQI